MASKFDDDRYVVHALGCLFSYRFNVCHHSILEQERFPSMQFRDAFHQLNTEIAQISVAWKLDESDFSEGLCFFALSFLHGVDNVYW